MAMWSLRGGRGTSNPDTGKMTTCYTEKTPGPGEYRTQARPLLASQEEAIGIKTSPRSRALTAQYRGSTEHMENQAEEKVRAASSGARCGERINWIRIKCACGRAGKGLEDIQV